MRNQPEIPIHSLIQRFTEFNQNFSNLEKQVFAKYNVTKSGFAVLSFIKDEKISLNELAEHSGLDKSTLSRQVKNLEKKGFVMKESGKDKRFTYVSLPSESQQLILTISFELEKAYSLIFKSWPADEKQLLLVLMGRVNRSIQSFQLVK
ncbi:transcription regulator [Carnobacterium sp. AT7]|uniref:MarR family winged helix-turn-helix transcriptional regulator n=1 Tax=Carnobacterium TaxID=2747 RepID=UPI00015F0885|nr:MULTISPECIES: MarR family transcriptional regulator [Carnobacterium]EDP68369.1 transcription regulator [Carnobacterium sp. AT7]